jgi:hypothetical protein
MFKEFMRNHREKKYLKEYKGLATKPFCFQYEFLKSWNRGHMMIC